MANPESQSEVLKAIPIPLVIIEKEKPPEIAVTDFNALRQKHQQILASFWKDNAALIAAGQIPQLNLSMPGKPDSSITKTLSDGRKLSLTFDGKSHLSEVEVTSQDGDRDLAHIKNGKVINETRTAKGSEVTYRFDENRNLSQEIIVSSGSVEAFDFKDSRIVRAQGASQQSGISDDFVDQPNQHTYRVDQPDGQNLNFKYDENGKFQFGTDHQLGKGEDTTDKTWLISPDGHGGLNVVRGQEV